MTYTFRPRMRSNVYNAGQLLRTLSTTVPRSGNMSNFYHPDTPSEVQDAKVGRMTEQVEFVDLTPDDRDFT